jgi:hypothetical protein
VEEIQNLALIGKVRKVVRKEDPGGVRRVRRKNHVL